MAYDFLKDKVVLITGGTGSFGQKFVKILLEKAEPRKVIVFSRDELKQSEMKSGIPDPKGNLRFFIGDIRDPERLNRAFLGVDYVVHAAALKQVPALEYNPMEAVKTNILGTQNIINAALDSGVKKVVFISTDKAANPANLYGATKLCAERLIISSQVYAANEGETRFGAVRYGNVFGSRGSLIKIIEERRRTGKIPITHADMTRFWITLGEGVELALYALENLRGGEIFIPKLPSLKVIDLVKTLAPECELDFIGIRPGEKLHEILITPEEARHTKEFEKHYVILPEHIPATGGHYGAGKNLEEGRSFASHQNDNWLDAEGLKRFLDSV